MRAPKGGGESIPDGKPTVGRKQSTWHFETSLRFARPLWLRVTHDRLRNPLGAAPRGAARGDPGEVLGPAGSPLWDATPERSVGRLLGGTSPLGPMLLGSLGEGTCSKGHTRASVTEATSSLQQASAPGTLSSDAR